MTDRNPLHCFTEHAHDQHEWQVDVKFEPPRRYWCDGSDVVRTTFERDPWSPSEKMQHIPNPEATIEILDARSAYGDKVQNQVEQAAMINAYLSGRKVQPVDVPAIFMLVKLHRLGKMPDYKDNYDDIEGYLQIAKEVIGSDMIEATTAKEYMEIKNRREKGPTQNDEEGAIVEKFLARGQAILDRSDVKLVRRRMPDPGPRHPYENAERDMLRDVPGEHDERL
jgi:hypothetical protein